MSAPGSGHVRVAWPHVAPIDSGWPIVVPIAEANAYVVEVGRGSCPCRVLRAAGRFATFSSSEGRGWRVRLTILTVVEDHWVAVPLAGRLGGFWKWKQRVIVAEGGRGAGKRGRWCFPVGSSSLNRLTA